jgi:RNA polymerase sigma-70 factor (ECF subfamily)
MSGDPHLGEDLTQETFVRLYSRRKTYEPTARFSTFLWRIALNLCYDELRRQRRRRECALNDPDADGSVVESLADSCAAPDRFALECERAMAVRRALMEIGEPRRTVVVLRHFEGLKFREIAEVLGIPEGTVKSRMADALAQLNFILNPLVQDLPASPERNQETMLL